MTLKTLHPIFLAAVILMPGFSPEQVSAAPKAETKAATKSKAKPKKTAASKNDQAKSEEAVKLKKANDMLKSLSRSKKSAFTKLLKSGKKEDLMALPGVGEAIAKAIIKARPLKSSAHLILVSGIGEKKFKQIVDSRK